ncbi:alpha/beta fold hydrolase [Dactylosporangium sp. CA-092794]|uniref:alpha/beta fold hydrolase n=1 Tax=Dactylosporangium sp. CA-092794 TaxID=3239929 RepID=UPI003D9142CC
MIVNGSELHYDDIPARQAGGSPTTIVWLHGFLFTAELFRTVIDGLPAYRHIAIDSRGHGRSAGVTTDPTVSQMADDAWAILQHLGVDRFVVVGHSLGNAVGMRLVSRHPDSVVAAVSLAGVPIAGLLENTREGNLALPALQGDEEAMAAMLAALFVHESVEAIVKKGAAAASLVSSEVLTSISLTELYRNDRDEILPGLTQPWLFIVPENDLAIAAESQEATARQIPGARILILRGEGHIYPQERPDATAAYIGAFLTSVGV